VGCGGGGGGGGGKIPTSDADGLTSAVAASVGNNVAQKVTGDPPPPTPEVPDSPVTTARADAVSVSPGASVTVPLDVTAASQLESLFAKIPGASSFFQVSNPAGAGKAWAKRSATAKGTFVLEFRLKVPSNVDFGRFCIQFSVEDVDTRVSNVDEVCIDVVQSSPSPTPSALSVSAGPDRSVGSGESVTLDGSASSNSQISSVLWEQISGPTVSIQNADQLTASFVAPEVSQGTEMLMFTLTVADASGASDSDEVAIEVAPVQLSEGPLRFTLTWDQANDQDLYVQEPSGALVYYGSDYRCATPPSGGQPASGCNPSPDGGSLDVDDTDGFGPENIFYPQEPPNGTYCYGVEYFSGSVPTAYTIRVTADGALIRTETGTLAAQDEFAFFVATKNGSAYTFRAATANDADTICPFPAS
ncbi:MAG: PKD domain-containing protein, partial [Gammaproteobacteria bacterium]